MSDPVDRLFGGACIVIAATGLGILCVVGWAVVTLVQWVVTS